MTTTKTATAPNPAASDVATTALIRGLPGGEALLTGWPSSAIALVVDAAIEDLAGVPGADKSQSAMLGNRLWERARSLPCGPQGLALDVQLSRLPLSKSPVLALAELLRVLLAAGDVATTLHQQRAAIDRRLERLAELRATGAPR